MSMQTAASDTEHGGAAGTETVPLAAGRMRWWALIRWFFERCTGLDLA